MMNCYFLCGYKCNGRDRRRRAFDAPSTRTTKKKEKDGGGVDETSLLAAGTRSRRHWSRGGGDNNITILNMTAQKHGVVGRSPSTTTPPPPVRQGWPNCGPNQGAPRKRWRRGKWRLIGGGVWRIFDESNPLWTVFRRTCVDKVINRSDQFQPISSGLLWFGSSITPDG